MKFDFLIGNPPYQEEQEGGNKTYATPVYNLFIDAAYHVADKVELIHPARFLFNAGSTPKQWNKRMLNDPNVKVIYYEQRSSNIFPNTEIKGGIAITYRDKNTLFGEIGTFTPYQELNSILRKVCHREDFTSFSTMAITSYAYHFTDKLHVDHPEIKEQLSEGHAFELKSNVFEKIPQVFFSNRPNDGEKYIQIIGREKNQRVFKYIKAVYVNRVENLEMYKVVLPAATGNGGLGEEISSPFVAGPNVGSTETFCSIGCFSTNAEAENALKYIKTKFTRALLSVLKVTQHLTPDKWFYVPAQGFTPSSDIDWSKPIPQIDQQLYRKYGLTDEEITFIESHVKEMT